MTGHQLREALEQAFLDVPCPRDIDIVGGIYDGTTWRMEWDDAYLACRGRRWQDLTAEKLQGCSLVWFEPPGFHYYLPAFLLAGLEDMQQAICVAFAVTPSRRENKEASEANIRRLTPQQRSVVVAFLEEYVSRDMLDHGDIAEAVAFLKPGEGEAP